MCLPGRERTRNLSQKREGRIAARTYEWVLELPVPLVLGVMWFIGVVFISLCALALYSYWLALQAVAGGRVSEKTSNRKLGFREDPRRLLLGSS